MKVYLLYCWLGDGKTIGLFSSEEAATKGAEEHVISRYKGVLQPAPDKDYQGHVWMHAFAPDLQFSYSIEEFNLDEVKLYDWEKHYNPELFEK
jgi:hypothetical protein